MRRRVTHIDAFRFTESLEVHTAMQGWWALARVTLEQSWSRLTATRLPTIAC